MIIKYTNNILHLNFDTQYELTATFMRLQEFYECPSDSIRGKFFTHAEFMDDYANRHGNFTYCTDWSGFNIPGNIVLDFFDKFVSDLSTLETFLFNILNKQSILSTNKFYIIGTYGNNNNCIDHEHAHAFWYLCPEYKEKIQKLINKLTIKKSMTNVLLKMGYNQDQIPDEIQAHLCTSTMKELKNIFKIRTNWKIVPEFKKIFRQTKM